MTLQGMFPIQNGLYTNVANYAALNEALTNFYATSCSSTPPEEWLEKNPYNEAFFDNSEEWMDC